MFLLWSVRVCRGFEHAVNVAGAVHGHVLRVRRAFRGVRILVCLRGSTSGCRMWSKLLICIYKSGLFRLYWPKGGPAESLRVAALAKERGGLWRTARRKQGGGLCARP